MNAQNLFGLLNNPVTKKPKTKIRKKEPIITTKIEDEMTSTTEEKKEEDYINADELVDKLKALRKENEPEATKPKTKKKLLIKRKKPRKSRDSFTNKASLEKEVFVLKEELERKDEVINQLRKELERKDFLLKQIGEMIKQYS